MKFVFLFVILSAGVTLASQQQIPLHVLDGKFSATDIEQMKKMDVVEAMKMAGYGEGLGERRVVQVFGEKSLRIVTEGEKLRLKKAGYDFMDISDHHDLGRLNAAKPISATFDISQPFQNANLTRSIIQGTFDDAIDHLKADITQLSSFWNRNYRSQWGRLSSHWVYEHVKEIVANSKLNISVSKVYHDFPQTSVIARIEDPNSNVADKAVVILGAHQDSLNYKLPFYRAPGADDDGSGSVTIMHVLRSLLRSGFVPPKDIAVEFHWYAAEEAGLLGSLDIAAAYEKRGVRVKSMLQMDATAVVKPGTTPIIGFFDEAVDKNLTTFCTKLVEAYIPLPWNLTGCGATCGSDHMSWTKAGYPAAYATEGLFESYPHDIFHTEYDSIHQEGWSFEHMLELVKLGIAYITEVSVTRAL